MPSYKKSRFPVGWCKESEAEHNVPLRVKINGDGKDQSGLSRRMHSERNEVVRIYFVWNAIMSALETKRIETSTTRTFRTKWKPIMSLFFNESSSKFWVYFILDFIYSPLRSSWAQILRRAKKKNVALLPSIRSFWKRQISRQFQTESDLAVLYIYRPYINSFFFAL